MSLEPRIPSPWGRLLVLVAVYGVFTFLFAYVFLSAMGLTETLAEIAADPAADANSIFEDPKVLSGLLLIQALIGIACVAGMTVWIDRRPPGTSGLGGVNAITGRTFLWGLMLGIVLSSVTLLSVSAIGKRHIRPELFADSSGGWALFLVLVLAGAAYMEEVLARGYLYRSLREQLTPARTILITALVFAALHRTNPGSGLVAWTNVFLIGLVLGQLREITGGISVPFGLHAGWNLTLGMVFGAQVSGISLPSLFRVRLQDLPEPLGGGEFGPEASSVVTLLFGGLAVWLALRMTRAEEHERR